MPNINTIDVRFIDNMCAILGPGLDMSSLKMDSSKKDPNPTSSSDSNVATIANRPRKIENRSGICSRPAAIVRKMKMGVSPPLDINEGMTARPIARIAAETPISKIKSRMPN